MSIRYAYTLYVFVAKIKQTHVLSYHERLYNVDVDNIFYVYCVMLKRE